MKKSSVQKVVLLAVLLTSLLSFVYLQQQNGTLELVEPDEVVCVEDSTTAQESVFAHIALVKRLSELGHRLLTTRF